MGERGLVLVTGGSGFVAGHCIRALLGQGFRVRATVRNAARAQTVRAAIGGLAENPHLLSFVSADLNKDVGWVEATEHCQYVLHLASPFPAVSPRKDADIVGPARDGALRVLRAARDESVKRVVLTSSIAAVAYGRGGRTEPFSEEDWSDETNRRDTSAYERSKTIAERSAWEFMEKEGGATELVVINPAAVIGPVLSPKTSTSIELIRVLLSGELPGCPRISYALVDVRDVADLHVRAMLEPRASGERFIAGGPLLSMLEIARVLVDTVPDLAVRTRTLPLPDALVRVAAAFNRTLRDHAFELGVSRPVTWGKAESMLGWRPRDLRTSIAETAISLFEHGVLRHDFARRPFAPPGDLRAG